MSFEDFLKARKVTDKASEDLDKAMSALQVRMADRLVELLRTLKVDARGNIERTDTNVVAMAEIVRLLKSEMVDAEWVTAVTEYVSSFDDIEDAVLRYGSSLGEIDTGVLTAIKAHYQTTIAEFLLTPDSFSRSLFMPIDRTLSAAVTVGAEFQSTQDALKDHIKGTPDTLGGVQEAAKGPADTSATIYERSATQTIADQVGIEIFMYQGRNIDTTRPFCKERSGHAWHRKEIEKWADLEWAGKVDGTDAQTIFVYLGGWYGNRASCRHVLVPIAVRDTPKADLDRMREKGLIPK